MPQDADREEPLIADEDAGDLESDEDEDFEDDDEQDEEQDDDEDTRRMASRRVMNRTMSLRSQADAAGKPDRFANSLRVASVSPATLSRAGLVA